MTFDHAADREVRFYRAARAAIARTVAMHGSLVTTRAAFEVLHGGDGTAIFDQALADAREDDAQRYFNREAVEL